MKMDAKLKQLFLAAKKARAHAHAPHSGCQVGAALRLTNGKIYSGCNVENSSYGGTVCAERGAIQTAVCAEGKIQIREVLVVTEASPPWMPCGLCRQILSEFVDSAPSGDIPIYATNLSGEVVETSLLELYPGLFSRKQLQGSQRKRPKKSPRRSKQKKK